MDGTTAADLLEELYPSQEGDRVQEEEKEEGEPRRVSMAVIRRPVTITGGSLRLDKSMISVRLQVPGKVRLESVRIEGSGLKGADWERMNGMFEVFKGQVEMVDCHIVMTGKDTPNCAALTVCNGSKLWMEGCSVEGSPSSYGLLARGKGTRVSAKASTFTFNDQANIGIWRGAWVQLSEGCKVSNSKSTYGLAARGEGCRLHATGCEFSNNYYDNVYLSEGADAEIIRCVMKGSQCRSGLHATGSDANVIVHESTIHSNREQGVRASYGAHVECKKCTITGNECEAVLSEGTHTDVDTWGCDLDRTICERRTFAQLWSAACDDHAHSNLPPPGESEHYSRGVRAFHSSASERQKAEKHEVVLTDEDEAAYYDALSKMRPMALAKMDDQGDSGVGLASNYYFNDRTGNLHHRGREHHLDMCPTSGLAIGIFYAYPGALPHILRPRPPKNLLCHCIMCLKQRSRIIGGW
eukprot:gene20298-27057_t